LYVVDTAKGISKKTNLTINFIKKKMVEYDELIKEEKKIIQSDPELKDINKFGIGHNINAFDTIVEENKTRTKPLFKTIEVNIKRRTVIVDDVLS
jgi:UDP-N-acetylglucosamine pyrophosphorylase